LNKRGYDEDGATWQRRDEERERHSKKSHHQARTGCSWRTVVVSGGAPTLSTGTWITCTSACTSHLPEVRSNQHEITSSLTLLHTRVYTGAWIRTRELVTKTASGEQMVNDERIESEDDEERDEGVEDSVHPWPDVCDENLVTFSASTVGHVGAGNLTASAVDITKITTKITDTQTRAKFQVLSLKGRRICRSM